MNIRNTTGISMAIQQYFPDCLVKSDLKTYEFEKKTLVFRLQQKEHQGGPIFRSYVVML